MPHFVTTDDGSLPTDLVRSRPIPYNEKAVMLRALENTVFVAAANNAGPDQGSITGIISPDGRLLASLPYGQVGVVAGRPRPGRGDARARPALGPSAKRGHAG